MIRILNILKSSFGMDDVIKKQSKIKTIPNFGLIAAELHLT